MTPEERAHASQLAEYINSRTDLPESNKGMHGVNQLARYVRFLETEGARRSNKELWYIGAFVCFVISLAVLVFFCANSG